MKIKKLVSFATAFLLSLSSLLIMQVPKALAATVTWSGAGGDSKFSTATNWVGGVAPTDGDNLIFDFTGLSANQTPNNDNLSSVGSITFQGSGTQTITLTGGAITLQGGISNTSSRYSEIDLDVTLGADQSFASSAGGSGGGVSIGAANGSNTLNLSTFTLTLDTTDKNTAGINSVVSGSGNIIKSGAGYGGLYSANTYTGATTISAGLLYAGDPTSLGGVGTGTTVADGAALSFIFKQTNKIATVNEPLAINGTSYTDSANVRFGALSAGASCGVSFCNDANITFAGTLTITKDLAVDPSSGTDTITGAINGAHKLSVLTGAYGILIINSSSNNSQTANGTYTVDGAVTPYPNNLPAVNIFVGDKETALITGTYGFVDVRSGGILKGTGTVSGILVENGGTVAPGQSPGCINTGNLTINGALDEEIGGTDPCTGYDQLKVTGTVDVTNGTLNVSRFNDFKPAAGQTYTIIDNDAADAVTGTFQNLAEGSTFTVDGYVFQISYVGGDGNDVVLVVKTVPGTPNTGVKLLSDHPLITLFTTSLLAGAIALIARRYNKLIAAR